eukprot:1164372-Rhodomonas_salina.2
MHTLKVGGVVSRRNNLCRPSCLHPETIRARLTEIQQSEQLDTAVARGSAVGGRRTVDIEAVWAAVEVCVPAHWTPTVRLAVNLRL